MRKSSHFYLPGYIDGRWKLYTIAAVLFIMQGCASTPDISPLPAPDITSSSQIDATIRRPTPVYAYPETQDQNPDALPGANPPMFEGPTTYSNSSTTNSPTVMALLDQASKQEQSGSPERAAATLERALRIEPRNARLWHRLAVLRFQQGQFTLAESLAAKSSMLAQGDWSLKQKNAELIEQVHQRRPYIR
jgi:tetratricopeptide (TPR) repeat protein